MKYDQVTDGEWVQPRRKGYKAMCCDCGLVHRVNFRLVKNKCGKGKTIQLQIFRDNRATGQVRRWMDNVHTD